MWPLLVSLCYNLGQCDVIQSHESTDISRHSLTIKIQDSISKKSIDSYRCSRNRHLFFCDDHLLSSSIYVQYLNKHRGHASYSKLDNRILIIKVILAMVQIFGFPFSNLILRFNLQGIYSKDSHFVQFYSFDGTWYLATYEPYLSSALI